MKPFKNIILVCTLVLTYLGTVESIKCYRCESTNPLKNPYQCNEYFEDSELVPEPCDDVYGAKYCIKQIGRFEGGLGTKRFCSSADLGNYCNYVRQPGDVMEYRSCYFTCSGDGCNVALSLKPTVYLFIISYLVYLVC